MSLENNSGSFKSFNQNYSYQPSSGGKMRNRGAETSSNIGNNVSNSGESNKIPSPLQTGGFKDFDIKLPNTDQNTNSTESVDLEGLQEISKIPSPLQTGGYKNPRDSINYNPLQTGGMLHPDNPPTIGVDYNPLQTGGMLHPSELQTPGLPSDGNQTTSSDDH